MFFVTFFIFNHWTIQTMSQRNAAGNPAFFLPQSVSQRVSSANTNKGLWHQSITLEENKNIGVTPQNQCKHSLQYVTIISISKSLITQILFKRASKIKLPRYVVKTVFHGLHNLKSRQTKRTLWNILRPLKLFLNFL